MDHHLSPHAEHARGDTVASPSSSGALSSSAGGPSTAVAAIPARTTKAPEPGSTKELSVNVSVAPASSPRAGGGAWGKHKLRNITRARMHTIIQPVRSFEDCAKRFDSIERSLESVSKNVNAMLVGQAETQQKMLAAIENMSQAQHQQEQQQQRHQQQRHQRHQQHQELQEEEDDDDEEEELQQEQQLDAVAE